MFHRKLRGNLDGRGVEVNAVRRAAQRKERVLVRFGKRVVPSRRLFGLRQKFMTSRDPSQRKAPVADARGFFVAVTEVRDTRPRRTDIVVAERAKIFQRVIENERVKLINQNVVEVRERRVEFGRQEQIAVSRDALEERRREVRNHVAFREVGENFSFGRDEYQRVVAKDATNLRKRNPFKGVNLFAVNGNDHGDFCRQNFSPR